MFGMNWLVPVAYLVILIGVLIGVWASLYLPQAWKRHKVEQTLIVAERTTRQARTKGVAWAMEDETPDLILDPAIIFGHPAPFSDSELDVLAEAVARSVNPPTSRPYITGGA